MNRSRFILPVLFLLLVPCAVQAGIMLPGLEAPVTVVRDSNGIPHIYAENEHDLFFMQGWVHAEDRLFQMDIFRRIAAATVAEVLGTPALPSDIDIRFLGLNRAAERSLAAHPQGMIDILQAYSDGVNSYIDAAEAAGQLPPEYAGLGLFSVKRWDPLDSVLAGKALGAGTSLEVSDDIDLAIALATYQAVGAATNLFDGNLLFFEDLFRSAPFDPASTIPDAMESAPSAGDKGKLRAKFERFNSVLDERTIRQGRDYLERIRKLPKIPGLMSLHDDDMGGSNSWVISGQHTPTGRPLLANDMHLKLESPTIFHEVHLVAPGFEVTGSSLPGAPCVVRGHNRSIAWGITNARLDITDIYTELVVLDPGTPSGLATVENGIPEPVEVVLETFKANLSGTIVTVDTRPVFTVPRRSNGPLITNLSPGPQPGTFTALSVQSVGFGPTRDPEGICGLNRAHNLDEFKNALQLIDFASQHVTYADTEGNIGYFISGELPLRQDLQNPLGPITPPYLIRSGFGGNGWIPIDGALPENQATPYEILPFNEMPQVVNPPAGFIVNANNDSVGNNLDNNPLNDLREGGIGLRYLNWGGRSFSIRAGRVSEMIRTRLSGDGNKFGHRGKLSFREMKSIQADTVLNDAKALLPFILQAFENAGQSNAHPLLASISADPGVGEAVQRLRDWNFTTPTGIAEGYDANPQRKKANDSVAATIYSTWRGSLAANSIDATLDAFTGIDMPKPGNREEVVTALQHLLNRDGVGVSGLNFFNIPGVSEPAVRRDILVLKSLADALDLLASDAFAPAFANSANQDDYRWGKLHRIVIRHPLGSVEPNFNIPPGFGLFPAPLDGLDGIPVDGGFETVDTGSPLDANNIRVSDSNSFMFDVAPTGRFVARPGRHRVKAVTSLPGGNSNFPGSPYYLNLLEPYLGNKTFPLLTSPKAVNWDALSTQSFVPAAP